jgi:CDP-4-dehydro-6-deoxyglucose reductase/terephthalate 1,2-dioxygenase reductase component
VLQGELLADTGGGSHESGISAADEHLFCRAAPASDLVIAPRSWQRVDPDARKTFQATVFRNQLVAPDVSVLHLRLPAGQRARFAAGQYLEVILPDGQRRAFSMANAPHENDGVQLHIRHMPGKGFTASAVPGLVKGDSLRIELPHGDFRLREDSDRPLLFVAGGTGFAPVKSIIDHIIKRGIERPMTLFWGCRDPSGLYAGDVVARWQRQRPTLRYEPVISDPLDAASWPGRRGLVHQAVLDSFESLSGFDVYACGAPAMIQALRTALQAQRGLPADQFFSDSFVSSPATPG